MSRCSYSLLFGKASALASCSAARSQSFLWSAALALFRNGAISRPITLLGGLDETVVSSAAAICKDVAMAKATSTCRIRRRIGTSPFQQAKYGTPLALMLKQPRAHDAA